MELTHIVYIFIIFHPHIDYLSKDIFVKNHKRGTIGFQLSSTYIYKTSITFVYLDYTWVRIKQRYQMITNISDFCIDNSLHNQASVEYTRHPMPKLPRPFSRTFVEFWAWKR